MNIFKSFGLKKARSEAQQEEWKRYWNWINEQDRQDALDADVDPYGTGEYAENVKQDFLDAQARKPEPGEDVPVKGRKTIDEDPAEKSERMMRRQEHWDRGGKKGQTLADTRVGRSVSGTRPRQRDPMPYEGRGKDFGIGGAYRKPKAEVMNMFKIFGINKGGKIDPRDYPGDPERPKPDYPFPPFPPPRPKPDRPPLDAPPGYDRPPLDAPPASMEKDDVSGKNYGGGKLSPSSEKQEDEHPDEDKKKTPNGGGENGD